MGKGIVVSSSLWPLGNTFAEASNPLVNLLPAVFVHNALCGLQRSQSLPLLQVPRIITRLLRSGNH
jgi:hypothetical protein